MWYNAYMSEDNGKENVTEYASLRIKAKTNRKIKVLAGLDDMSSLEVVEILVDKAYRKALLGAVEDFE